MTVTVVHPQVQHSHEAARALAECGLLEQYVTSVFVRPEQSVFFPGFLKRELAKRYHAHIPPEKVVTLPYPELLWKIAGKFITSAFHERLFYYNVWAFDTLAAGRVAHSSARIAVGYENSCREIFKAAKKAGKYCVLDAASVHFSAQKKVYSPPYSTKFLDKVNRRKAEEIALADHILTLSSHARDTYVRAGVPAAKITVIPPGVDSGLFSPDRRSPGNGGFHALFVGNLKLSKGVDLLLEAFERLNAPGKTLTLIGARGDAEACLRGRSGGICLKGHMPHAELVEEYRKADIFVLSSRLDGFGLVVAEAMACGTPVIVSTHVGARDLVHHGENGWIFPSGDVDALCGFLDEARRKGPALEVMGRNARRAVLKQSWERYREDVRSFYRSLLGRLP